MAGYQGIFLDEESKAALAERQGFPLEKTIDDMHITFLYGDIVPYTEEQCKEMHNIKVVGYAGDGKNSAFEVELPDELKSLYNNNVPPHITVSIGDGGKPKDSGHLKFEKLDEPFTVKGNLKNIVWERKRDVNTPSQSAEHKTVASPKKSVSPREAAEQKMVDANLENIKAQKALYREALKERTLATEKSAAKTLAYMYNRDAYAMETIANVLRENIKAGVFQDRKYENICNNLDARARDSRNRGEMCMEIAETGNCRREPLFMCTLQKLRDAVESFKPGKNPIAFMYGPDEVVLNTAARYAEQPISFQRTTPAFFAALMRDVMVYEENGGSHETVEEMKTALEELKQGGLSRKGFETVLEHMEEFPNIADHALHKHTPYDVLDYCNSIDDIIEDIDAKYIVLSTLKADTAIRYAESGEQELLGSLKSEHKSALDNLKVVLAVADCYEFGLFDDIPEAQGLAPSATDAVIACRELVQDIEQDIAMEVGNPENERWVYNMQKGNSRREENGPQREEAEIGGD